MLSRRKMLGGAGAITAAAAAASVSKDPPGGQVGIIEACVGFVLLVALLPLAVLLTLFDRRG